MATELIVTNVFRLTDGITVIACKGANGIGSIEGRVATLVADGKEHQELVLEGERKMLNQAREGERAIETRDSISITQEEAQSRSFKLVLP
jgi:hypothetical protein